jgi:hypothetical protein
MTINGHTPPRFPLPPLQVAVSVHPDAEGVVRFLREHGHELQTIARRVFDDTAPPNHRLLCVTLADRAAVDSMAAEMRATFAATADETSWNLTDRVLLVELPLETFGVVFLDIAVLHLE